MRYIFLLMLLSGAACAVTIPNGECQNFTLFNETDNSTVNESICAGNATIVYNITNVTNVTNVTNITVVECNATNATLWANSTGTFNNATVTCLANSTVVYVNQTINVTQNITSCPGSNTTVWANSTQTIGNQSITCLSNWTATIPANHCYQNVNINPAGYSQVLFYPACNISIVTPPSTTVCPTQAACLPYQYYEPCKTCETCETCQEQAACPTTASNESRLNETTASLDACTTTIYGAGGLRDQITAKDGIISQYQVAATTIDSSVDKKVEAKTGDITGALEIGLLTIIGGFGFWVFKTRTSPIPTKYGKVVTADEIDKLVPPKPTED